MLIRVRAPIALLLVVVAGLTALAAQSFARPATDAALIPGTEASDPKNLPGYPSKTFPYFATPSGRIACEYRNGAISCTTYKGSAERGQDVWKVKARGGGRYAPIKANFPSEDLPRAKYGITYGYRTIKCRISEKLGIKCWNRAGHGFRVSIEKQRVF